MGERKENFVNIAIKSLTPGLLSSSNGPWEWELLGKEASKGGPASNFLQIGMGTVFPFLELLFPNEHLLCKFPLKMFPAQLRAVEERGINVKLLDKGQEKELQRKIDKQKVLLAIDRMSGNVKNIFSLLEREVKKSSAEEKGKGTWQKIQKLDSVS